MYRVLPLFLVVAIVSVSGLMAQDEKIELSLRLGYTLSEGVDIASQPVPGTNLEVQRVSPKRGFSWGAQVDYLATENFAIGFLWDQQYSKLVLDTRNITSAPSNVVQLSPGEYEIANMKNYNYHGVFTYNVGESDSTLRPFFFVGLGATHYSPGELTIRPNPASNAGGSIDSETQFSMSYGGGLKANVSNNVGFQLGGRWTPTYISGTTAGWLCDPFWGCHVLVDAEYSHQFELTGGISFRF